VKPRFLPQDQEVRVALLELDERRDRGNDPPVIVRVVCHRRAIGQVWDLAPGRSLFLAKNETVKPTIVKDEVDARRSDDRWPVVEACLPEVDGDPTEQARMMPRRCPAGHGVMLARSVLRDAVKRYRRSGVVVTIALRVERITDSRPIGVLGSVK
jgi:hypothetical protein